MPMGDDLAQHSLEMTTNASRMALELLKLLADFARKRMEKNHDANSKYGEDNKIYKGALNIKKFNEVAEKHGGYSQQTISSQDVEAVMAEAKKLNIPINVRDLGNGNSAVCFLKQDSELFEQGLKNIVAEKLRLKDGDYVAFDVKQSEIEPLKRELEKHGINADFVKTYDNKLKCVYDAQDKSVMDAIKSDFKEKHEEIANNLGIEYNSEKRSFRLTDGEKSIQLSKLPTEAKLNTILQNRFGYDEVSAAIACKKFEGALTDEQRKFFKIDTRQLEKISNFERNIKLDGESPLLKDFSFARLKARADNHNHFAVSNGDHVVHLIPDTMPRRSMEEEVRSKLGITDKAVITAIVDKSTTLNNKYKERDKEVNKDINRTFDTDKKSEIGIERTGENTFQLNRNGEIKNYSFYNAKEQLMAEGLSANKASEIVGKAKRQSTAVNMFHKLEKEGAVKAAQQTKETFKDIKVDKPKGVPKR